MRPVLEHDDRPGGWRLLPIPQPRQQRLRGDPLGRSTCPYAVNRAAVRGLTAAHRPRAEYPKVIRSASARCERARGITCANSTTNPSGRRHAACDDPRAAVGRPVGVGLSHPLPLRSGQAGGRIGHLPAALNVCGRSKCPVRKRRRELEDGDPREPTWAAAVAKAELTADIRARRRTALWWSTCAPAGAAGTTRPCAGNCTTPGSIRSTCTRSPTPAASRRPSPPRWTAARI